MRCGPHAATALVPLLQRLLDCPVHLDRVVYVSHRYPPGDFELPAQDTRLFLLFTHKSAYCQEYSRAIPRKRRNRGGSKNFWSTDFLVSKKQAQNPPKKDLLLTWRARPQTFRRRLPMSNE